MFLDKGQKVGQMNDSISFLCIAEYHDLSVCGSDVKENCKVIQNKEKNIAMCAHVFLESEICSLIESAWERGFAHALSYCFATTRQILLYIELLRHSVSHK